jgi:hypothetical protein
MTYQANIFARGQAYRAAVIRYLAESRLDLPSMPEGVGAGETIRRAFYDGDCASTCARRIEKALYDYHRTVTLVVRT